MHLSFYYRKSVAQVFQQQHLRTCAQDHKKWVARNLRTRPQKKVAQPEDEQVLADLQPIGDFLSDNGTELFLYYILI
jgi:hypothetical protein